MPLVQKRDPGGWMSPKLQGQEEGRVPTVPIFTSRNEPVGRTGVAISGDPAFPYSRVALVGLM